jgi:N-acetyl-gamma-glutamyl-phosphate/LysW-gamma-L-alpha-aminoadipyl-6-phosphate reductase
LADQKITVAIAGASGYTGGELIRLLLDHPGVEMAFLSSERNSGGPVGMVHPALRNHPRAAGLKFRPLGKLPEVDVAFACLPTGELPQRLPLLAGRANRVLNLAGDFRLADPREVAHHYPATVANPAPGAFAYYIPELSPAPPENRFINLPGCMAVATIYALYPLFAESLARPDVVADAKTGSTGGGRGASEHPAERAGNFRVHKLHGHRHTPEIRETLARLTGAEVDLHFSAHSLDVPRGIMVTAYSRLRDGIAALDVKRAFARAYVGKPFVRVRPAPRTPQEFPMFKAVVGSNVAEVAIAVRGDRVVSVTALDNLVKGASGQAIQAMNLIFGLPETSGLPLTAAAP